MTEYDPVPTVPAEGDTVREAEYVGTEDVDAQPGDIDATHAGEASDEDDDETDLSAEPESPRI